MLNYYELIKLIGVENVDAVEVIRESFRNDWISTFSSIQINKTTRKNAVKAYSGRENFMMDENTKGLYCDGVSILYTSEDAAYTTSKTTDISKFMKEFLQNKKPTEVHMKESYAIAKNLGWSAGSVNKDKPYYIEIEGNFFNFSLVWSLFSCIADNSNKYNPVTVEIQTNKKPGNNALIMSSKYGIAVVLPFCTGDHGSYTAHNVDFTYYMESENELDSFFIEYCKKSA